jgi:hypothetical protein
MMMYIRDTLAMHGCYCYGIICRIVATAATATATAAVALQCTLD